ncbi:hypothetical protein BDZ97DRAFT_1902518 [Flammula alnicola]|nr:hypothetical protein BDZ97DRAFT_1902518 [Flammula alnicola]
MLPDGSRHVTPTIAKRAETRQCPVCDEQIPLRLLSKHAELESERVEQIINNVGSSDLPYNEMADEPGPSSRVRRSAIKARKSMATRNVIDSIEQSSKTIQNVKRHRKQRNTKLKEMVKDDEEGGNPRDSWLKRFTGEEITCPVCSATVRGDQDVLDAHVDACLAHEAQRLEDARHQELQHRRAIEEEVWEDGDDAGSNGNYVGDVRGAGFYTRINEEEVDEEIDIDGDDHAIFGEPQFTERDVVPVNIEREDVSEDVDVEIEVDEDDEAQQEQKTLRDLVAAGKAVKRRPLCESEEPVKSQMQNVMSVSEIDKSNLSIASARQRGDKNGLISALETKVKQLESTTVPSTSLLCRICIDSYTEPTVLGSTKLCPICKRITGAADLRRVYL